MQKLVAHQDKIDQFLLNSANHAERPKQIEYKETHISKLYLTANYVYKRKKSVALDFVDFSSLDRRYQACLDELRLNRRLAPKTYLALLPLYSGQEGISWQTSSKEDQPIEWLVHMQRLPQSEMLDQRLRDNKPPKPKEMQELAALLCKFYQQERIYQLQAEPWLQSFWLHSEQNFSFLLEANPQQETLIRSIESRQKDFLFFRRDLLTSRIDKALICDGHGDLKPEHICLVKPPVIYDCVEFDASYRQNDILDELSFFALECEFMGFPQIGDELISRVMPEFDNDLTAGAFYRSYRACVRAKIEGINAKNASSAEAKSKKTHAMQRYLELANKYAKRLDPPQLFVIGGLMGSGKSTLARALAKVLGAEHLESDKMRQEVFPHAGDELAAYGQGLYQPERRAEVYHKLHDLSRQLLLQARSVVVDASFISRKNRLRFQELAKELSLPFQLLWCDCEASLAKERIARRRTQEKSASHARPELYDEQRQNFEDFAGSEQPLLLDSSLEVDRNVRLIQKHCQRSA